jgi:hypothetical protein
MPRHVSSNSMLIFRRSKLYFTASGMSLCERPYSALVESGLQLCIKLVIKTNLYYDARPEKHKKSGILCYRPLCFHSVESSDLTRIPGQYETTNSGAFLWYLVRPMMILYTYAQICHTKSSEHIRKWCDWQLLTLPIYFLNSLLNLKMCHSRLDPKLSSQEILSCSA